MERTTELGDINFEMAAPSTFVGLLLIGLAASAPNCSQVGKMKEVITWAIDQNPDLLPLLLRLGKCPELV